MPACRRQLLARIQREQHRIRHFDSVSFPSVGLNCRHTSLILLNQSKKKVTKLSVIIRSTFTRPPRFQS